MEIFVISPAYCNSIDLLHILYFVKWVPANKCDEVTSAFVDVVDRANKLSSVQTSGAAETEKEDDDYGC